MRSELRPALLSLLLFTVLTGFAYPVLVTSIAHLTFPGRADGSLITKAGRPAGSELIGQPFDAPGYFWSRPSATAPAYNAAASSGSNLGPMNPALRESIVRRVDSLHAADPSASSPVPIDLVTTSGSGLDPHVSPAAALYQVERVAHARSLDADRVRSLVNRLTEGRQLGFLGEPRVNVLKLNLALDSLAPAP